MNIREQSYLIALRTGVLAIGEWSPFESPLAVRARGAW